jgi:hypothetical protein
MSKLRAVTTLYRTVLSVHRVIGIQGEDKENTPWRHHIDALWEDLGRKQSGGKSESEI